MTEEAQQLSTAILSTDTPLDGTCIKAVEDLVLKYFKPQLVTLPGMNGSPSVPVLLLPKTDDNGCPQIEAVSIKPLLDEYRTVPETRKGIAKLGDLESFIAHCQRFQDTGSALFAMPDPKVPTLTSVLNYHPADVQPTLQVDGKTAGVVSPPRRGDHRGIYAFPVSDAWTLWGAQNGVKMNQAKFAEFIENVITEVLDPASAGDTAKAFSATLGCDLASPSKLLELSRGLSLRVGLAMKQAVNLGTGEVSMQFVSQHQDESGAPLKVPGAFLIGIPVFKNGAEYQLCVRLRYRSSGSSVDWFVELYRAEKIFDHAFSEACNHAQEKTGLPLFIGSAE